jgi:hypothetical protein
LGFRVADFRLGKSVVELLFEGVKIGLSHVQLRLRCIDFALRGSATL